MSIHSCKTKRYALTLLAGLAALSSQAINWSGTAGDGNISNPDNWPNSVLPLGTDNLTFANLADGTSLSMETNTTCNQLEFLTAGSTVLELNGGSLIVTNSSRYWEPYITVQSSDVTLRNGFADGRIRATLKTGLSAGSLTLDNVTFSAARSVGTKFETWGMSVDAGGMFRFMNGSRFLGNPPGDIGFTGVAGAGFGGNGSDVSFIVDNSEMHCSGITFRPGSNCLIDICNGSTFEIGSGVTNELGVSIDQGNCYFFCQGATALSNSRCLIRDGSTFVSRSFRSLGMSGNDNVIAISNANFHVSNVGNDGFGTEDVGVNNKTLLHNAKVVTLDPRSGKSRAGAFFRLKGTDGLFLVTGAETEVESFRGGIDGVSNLFHIAECARFVMSDVYDFGKGLDNTFRFSCTNFPLVGRFRWNVNQQPGNSNVYSVVTGLTFRVDSGCTVTNLYGNSGDGNSMWGVTNRIVMDNGSYNVISMFRTGGGYNSRGCGLEFRGEAPHFYATDRITFGSSLTNTETEIRFILSGNGYTEPPISTAKAIVLHPGTIVRVDNKDFDPSDGRSKVIPLIRTTASLQSVDTNNGAFDFEQLKADAVLPEGAELLYDEDNGAKTISVRVPVRGTTVFILK